MDNHFQAKLNTVAAALHTMNSMSALLQTGPGYEKVIENADGLAIWESLCEDLMSFVKEASMPVGSAIIHLMTREGKISFTKILPHVDRSQYENTIVLYREYLRRLITVETRADEKLALDKAHREQMEKQTGLVDDSVRKPA